MQNTLIKARSGRISAFFPILFCLIVAFLLLFNGFLFKIDNWLNDAWINFRLSNQGQESALSNFFFSENLKTDDIVIVAIDDRSILGIPGLFKKDKGVFAKALNNLAGKKPKAIGVDVFFPDITRNDPDAERAFISTIKDKGNMVFKAYQRDEKRITPPYPALANSALIAPIHFSNRRDNAIRAAFLTFTEKSGKRHLSFQTQLYRLFKGISPDSIEFTKHLMKITENENSFEVPLISGNKALINFDRPIRSFNTISFSALYHNQIPDHVFKNKIVIIGSANSMTEEKFQTPVGSNVFSVFLHAQVLSNLIQKNSLKTFPEYLSILVAIIFSAIFLFVGTRISSNIGFSVLTFATILLVFFFSLFGYSRYNLQIDVMPAVFSVFASFLTVLSRKYYLELSEKLKIKTAFQHYVTASVVNEILKNPEKLNLHGEERNLTIFFSDIEGFTSISEGMSPLEVVSLLNEYLSEMTEIIFKYNGLLDKYEGDAIMAVYGAPVDQTDHAVRACRCALENQKALAKLRQKWAGQGKPEIRARIGINTGMVVVGNMGSKMRFDYTVIGDNVNLAARLETANKLMKTEILVSENTARLAEKQVISRYLGKLKVAGKANVVSAFEVLADRNDPDKEIVKKAELAKNSYEKAKDEFQHQNFDEAKSILEDYLKKNPDDKPARMLLEKSKAFLIVPPPPNWEDIITQEK
jgi:adenylate cyclase